MVAKYKVIIKGIIVDRVQKKLLLLKRADNDKISPNAWENPGGKMEYGESPLDALHREIAEECGLTVHSCVPVYAITRERKEPSILLAYICEAQNTQVRLSNEHDDFVWVSENEYRNYVIGDILSDFESYGVSAMIWR